MTTNHPPQSFRPDAHTGGPRTAHSGRGQLVSAAHLVFDRLWDGSFKYRGRRRLRAVNRTAAYEWLAEQLGITRDECHFSRMNAGTLQRAISIARDATPQRIEDWRRTRDQAAELRGGRA